MALGPIITQVNILCVKLQLVLQKIVLNSSIPRQLPAAGELKKNVTYLCQEYSFFLREHYPYSYSFFAGESVRSPGYATGSLIMVTKNLSASITLFLSHLISARPL